MVTQKSSLMIDGLDLRLVDASKYFDVGRGFVHEETLNSYSGGFRGGPHLTPFRHLIQLLI
jgi:hypothetical protein